jgi:hypothetical protein
MMAPSLAITAAKDPTSSPTSSTSTLHPIIVSTHPSNLFQHGFDTCSLAQAATSRSCKKQWPTLETGASPEKLPGTDSLTTTSRWWPSRLKSTNVTWMPPAHVLDLVSPDSCSHGLLSGSQPYKMCRERLELYARAGRKLPVCPGVSMCIPRCWRTSRMYEDVHHRVKGDVTGLGAAYRAGAHVSCATGQESVSVSVCGSGLPPV